MSNHKMHADRNQRVAARLHVHRSWPVVIFSK